MDPLSPSSTSPSYGHVFWGRGFRPFFLLSGLHAALFLIYWILLLSGIGPSTSWFSPFWWHAHEMIFGFAGATLAGFLLTAVPVWTGSKPVVGKHLILLVLLWLLGRGAFALAAFLPAELVAILDLPFFLALAFLLTPPIWKARRVRNYGFPLILLIFFIANLLIHLEVLRWLSGTAIWGVRLGIDLVLLVVVILGSRVTPGFTTNGLRRAGIHVESRAHPWIVELTVPSILFFILTDLLLLLSIPVWWRGIAALFAALILILRMSGWNTLRSFSVPLVWSLHLAYAWIPLGLLFFALSDFLQWVPPTTGRHALTVGAIGGMILAMMSRVSLGHTGRPLDPPRGVVIGYLLVTLAALLRTIAPLFFPKLILHCWQLAGVFWFAAFAAFVLQYGPMLLAPRIDGKEG